MSKGTSSRRRSPSASSPTSPDQRAKQRCGGISTEVSGKSGIRFSPYLRGTRYECAANLLATLATGQARRSGESGLKIAPARMSFSHGKGPGRLPLQAFIHLMQKCPKGAVRLVRLESPLLHVHLSCHTDVPCLRVAFLYLERHEEEGGGLARCG